jgi:membrane fusion protein (multidrug efflux system)
MPTSFERTWRALDADSSWLKTLGIAFFALLLAGWLLWFVYGQVHVYEVSRKTSLEAAVAAHPVATRISGRVLVAHLELGRRVKAGEVLIELDSEAERLALARSVTQLQGLKSQIAALRPEIKAHQAGLANYRVAAGLAFDQSRAQAEETRANSQFADAQMAARQKLLDKKMLSMEAFHEAEAKAKAGRASVRAHIANSARLQREGEVASTDRHAEIAKLERKLAEFEGLVLTGEAELHSIQERIDAHFIRAAIDGRLGRTEMPRVGAVAQAGQVFGAVIPEGELHAVAWFASSGVGRIQSGQIARIRLDGFPWTEFGTLAATVSSVGNDPLADQVRVELAIKPESVPSIPLGHGLTGSSEIEVGHISPAQLVLRAAGRLLTTRRGGNGVSS